ncbi:MAG TPA: exonuclease SbcC [Nitrosopumilaceae archaeon]|nr:exonuclease SbcC [Nitrosopumilaceae archaeon]
MVFGWGKKKNQVQDNSLQEEKKIKLSEIKPKIDEIHSLRSKTIIAEVKSFRKKIEENLNEISNIIKELEKDNLHVDDIDKHLEILVVRGKKQVIDTIKKENSEKLPEIKTYDDVVSLNTLITQRLKRIGDVLGRQSRVIHIFAKKYATKLKEHLATLNSDRNEIQIMIDNHARLSEDIQQIDQKISEYSDSKKNQSETEKRILELKNYIERFDKKIVETTKHISKIKSGKEYLKYQEAQKKLESLSSEQNEIKTKIDFQFTKISRPLGRYEHGSSLEKPQQQLMEKLVIQPFYVLTTENKNEIIKILSSVRKGIEGGTISVKDTEKSIANIDETIEMLDGFVKEIQDFTEKKNQLQKELELFNRHELKQNEELLEKTNLDKSDTESKIKRLEQENSNTTKQLPEILMDIEVRLRRVSSTKYRVEE